MQIINTGERAEKLVYHVCSHTLICENNFYLSLQPVGFVLKQNKYVELAIKLVYKGDFTHTYQFSALAHC